MKPFIRDLEEAKGIAVLFTAVSLTIMGFLLSAIVQLINLSNL